MRHQTAEMENAYITGTYGTKMQDWKMQEDRRIAAITTMDYWSASRDAGQVQADLSQWICCNPRLRSSVRGWHLQELSSGRRVYVKTLLYETEY